MAFSRQVGRRAAILGALAAGVAAVGSGCVNRPAASGTQGTTGAEAPSAAGSRTPSTTSPGAQPKPQPKPKPKTLPNGKRHLFPGTVLVGFCGTPGAGALGRMTGDLRHAGQRLRVYTTFYDRDADVLPVVELIATVASASPGADGKYRTRVDDAVIRRYLDKARELKGLLLLNIQPGAADFLPEVRAYERWLREPDVGVALDPEWATPRGVVPGQRFGTTTGRELDTVATYLAGLVRHGDLPDKVLVYHQVAASVVTGERGLKHHDGVAAIKSVDGIGVPASKVATWRKLMQRKPAHVRAGFKLFFDEDTTDGKLMSPEQVMSLRPKPVYVMYE